MRLINWLSKTYPTRAIKNEVCQRFLRHSCTLGRYCHRIHPRVKRLPPEVHVSTGTTQDQVLEAHNLEGPLVQTRAEDLPQMQVTELAVKLPSKVQRRAPLESAVSQVCLDIN